MFPRFDNELACNYSVFVFTLILHDENSLLLVSFAVRGKHTDGDSVFNADKAHC